MDPNGELNEQVQQQPNVEERQEEPAVVEDTTTVRLPIEPEARMEVVEENPLVVIEKPPLVVTEETSLVEEEQPTGLTQYVNELTSPTFGQLEDDMESVISEGGDNATEGKGELRRSRRTAAAASGGHKRSTPSSPTPPEANQTSNKSKKKKEKERGGGKPQC